VTSAADFLADAGQPQVDRDHQGRYMLPPLDGGKPRPWTRVTTFARAVADTYGLTVWQLRLAARGLAVRPDLVARLLSEPDDNRVCDEVVAQAQEHAGSTVAATLGTAMHRLTELIDGGEPVPPVTPTIRADLDAYSKALAAARLTVLHIERIVCVPELGVAGTLDRILDGRIGDLKTGADLEPSWREIVIQLALYAHGAAMWNLAESCWEPMPAVDQATAIVMHLPIGQARCDLYDIDIAAGWDAAVSLCGPVRAWRNRKGLARPHRTASATARPPAEAPDPDPVPASSPPDGAGVAHDDRAAWITGRLRGLAGDVRARNLVAQRWPDGVTIRPPWTGDDIAALADMLEGVEREVGAPFGASDPAAPEPPRLAAVPDPPERVPPWPVIDDGVVAEAEDTRALGATLASRDATVQATVRRWAQQGRREHRAFDGTTMTRRMWSCARAAIACATHLGDEDRTRRALAVVLTDPETLDGEPAIVGQTVPPLPDTWITGAVIGSLDAIQAEQLADLATAYSGGNAPDLDPL
jgi:hypothetical protein